MQLPLKACRDESLHAAAEAGDCTAARCALLARGNQFIDALGGAGNTTPLMVAVSSGHADCATLLIESSASLEATRSMKLTALMIAAIRGRDECCRLLCDASAAVDAVDEDGWSSPMYAAIHISQQHDECVNILLGAKADASHCKQNGFSCLMAAAVGGSAGSVRALLEGGASLGATSARGWSALTYAKAFHPSDDDGLLLVRDHVRMRASLQLDVAPWESELAALSIFDDMAAAAEEMRSLHQVAAADDALSSPPPSPPPPSLPLSPLWRSATSSGSSNRRMAASSFLHPSTATHTTRAGASGPCLRARPRLLVSPIGVAHASLTTPMSYRSSYVRMA